MKFHVQKCLILPKDEQRRIFWPEKRRENRAEISFPQFGYWGIKNFWPEYSPLKMRYLVKGIIGGGGSNP